MVLIDDIRQTEENVRLGVVKRPLRSSNESQRFDLAVDFNQTKGDSGDEEESLFPS